MNWAEPIPDLLQTAFGSLGDSSPVANAALTSLAAAAAAAAAILAAVGVLRRKCLAWEALHLEAPVAALPVPIASPAGLRPAAPREAPPCILVDGNRSPGAEAFRTLRTRILLLAQEQTLRSIQTTSAGPGEGKSTVAANLAIATARAGFRVLLVDADCHRRRLHGIFGLAGLKGFTDLLAHRGQPVEELAQALCLPTRYANLSLLPAGSALENTAELFAHSRLDEAVQALARMYELVIYDSPPVLSVADPAVLAPHMDGVLLVVRAGMYPREAVQQAHAELAGVHARMLGVVLNGIEPGTGGYYGHYRYAYYA